MRQKVIRRYSTAFKLQVLKEIEDGKLSIAEAQKLYGIKGGDTISSWMKKFGKFASLPIIQRIEVPGEVVRIKELEKELQTLKAALAQMCVENVSLKALIDVAEEYYKVDLKKNFSGKLSSGSGIVKQIAPS